MIPNGIFNKLATDSKLDELGISEERVLEAQSIDERPFQNGYWLVLDWQESTVRGPQYKGPRVLTVWVHHPQEADKDYAPINAILNRIEEILLSIEQYIGDDGIRITCIDKQGRSRNTIDPAMKTITRNATYGVLHDESMA